MHGDRRRGGAASKAVHSAVSGQPVDGYRGALRRFRMLGECGFFDSSDQCLQTKALSLSENLGMKQDCDTRPVWGDRPEPATRAPTYAK